MAPIAEAVAGVGQAIAGVARWWRSAMGEANTPAMQAGAERVAEAGVIAELSAATEARDVRETEKQLALVGGLVSPVAGRPGGV